ncbi:MAG: DUF4926 domain-containing protein [Methylophilaceae bacterium]|nr:DUF4926 domain-containing protein [Methylophilaceae bacterium]
MKLLDVVALTQSLPEKHLTRGQVGTIIEELDTGVYEVEFSDLNGKAYAMAAVEERNLMPLLHCAIAA